MMRAYHIRDEALHLEPTPKPHPKSNEVRIRVLAAGVNRADILQRKGKYPPPLGTTPIPGLELCGIVESVGEGVSLWQPGNLVMALVDGGAYAEFCCADEYLCISLPFFLSTQEGAALPEACFTFWNSLIEPGWINPNETILIHGGAGGIGSIAIQIAKALGLTVFTTVKDAEKAQLCETLGTHLTIQYSVRDFVEACIEHTHGKGVDIILDCIGGEYLPRNIATLAPAGRLVEIGCQKGSTGSLPLVEIMRKRLIITGSTLRDQPLPHKQRLALMLKSRLHDWLFREKLKPIVGATFPFEEAPTAHSYMEAQKHIGKIVLNLS